ncbi:MAG: MerR family transcriptional regulator [Sphingomonadales bacterium]|nr:MerR family transcriptional regulator [Sphingomonadales bacterium]
MTGDSRFDDGKADGAFRTIGEVARALGIRQHVLRYWEEQFPLLRPVKRSGGRRYYRPGDVALVEAIDRLVHREGYTLRGARLALEAAAKAGAGGVQAASAAEPMPAAAPRDDGGLIAQLRAIRSTLAAALEA